MTLCTKYTDASFFRPIASGIVVMGTLRNAINRNPRATEDLEKRANGVAGPAPSLLLAAPSNHTRGRAQTALPATHFQQEKLVPQRLANQVYQPLADPRAHSVAQRGLAVPLPVWPGASDPGCLPSLSLVASLG
jgi:hypothetical protein